ncbi:hypothetical protein JCM11491_000131 [Sporobolomyces phaffii]
MDIRAPECIICYDVPTTYGVLDSCAHPFCYECIRQWEASDDHSGTLLSRSSCPCCRQPFTLLFPSPAFFPDDDDRRDAIAQYRLMLAQTPCRDLDASPRHRRYCPRGTDCLYSHTLPHGLSTSSSMTYTYTYTFAHTYHDHLVVEQRVRSERGAKRVLEALFDFAATYDPESDDPRAYACALACEFERIHSRVLTARERDDVELWRVVEEVQQLAAHFGVGAVVDSRMDSLGRRNDSLGYRSPSSDHEGVEGEWTTDDDDSEPSDDDRLPPWRDQNRSPVSSTGSLPHLEEIDRDDEDENYEGEDDDLESDGGSRDLSRMRRNVLEAYDDSDEDYESDDWSDMHADSEDEDEDEDEASPPIPNPLRRPRHPRSRERYGGLSWTIETLSPRSLALRPIPPPSIVERTRPGLSGQLGVYAQERTISRWAISPGLVDSEAGVQDDRRRTRRRRTTTTGPPREFANVVRSLPPRGRIASATAATTENSIDGDSEGDEDEDERRL